MIITQTPFRMSFFGGGTDMESFFRENGGAVLSTTFDKYCYVNKDVEIGDCVWLGNNVIILGGVKIGEGAIIQAGSVVCKDIPPYAVAGGHPATPFKYRNEDHYKKMKLQNKYH